MHAQDAALLESFGWAPGNVWWQRKMKVLERRKKLISQALILQHSCSCELGMTLERWKDRKNALLQPRVSEGEF